MASIDNEYVVRLFCVCLGTRIMLVSEFVPFGALINHLKNYKSDLNARILLTFAAQIASVSSYNKCIKLHAKFCVNQGMKYLENIRMVHRDLAARNILGNAMVLNVYNSLICY